MHAQNKHRTRMNNGLLTSVESAYWLAYSRMSGRVAFAKRDCKPSAYKLCAAILIMMVRAGHTDSNGDSSSGRCVCDHTCVHVREVRLKEVDADYRAKAANQVPALIVPTDTRDQHCKTYTTADSRAFRYDQGATPATWLHSLSWRRDTSVSPYMQAHNKSCIIPRDMSSYKATRANRAALLAVVITFANLLNVLSEPDRPAQDIQ